MPMKKSKKVVIASDIEQPCCDEQDVYSYERGKSLVKIAIGLLLVSFGFGYIDINLLALVAGAIYCLVGVVRMMSKS